jgi:hypothetical protein
MSIAWEKDVDKGLTAAKAGRRPLLLDFNASPM